MWHGIVRPRLADREAPVRLMQAFQASGDSGVFAGQPRLYVPSPDLTPVRQVLADPRMRGRLPPSLQLGQPLGPLSRWVRETCRHATVALWVTLGAAVALAAFGSRRLGLTPGASSGET
jgi:hypothetical protein